MFFVKHFFYLKTLLNFPIYLMKTSRKIDFEIKLQQVLDAVYIQEHQQDLHSPMHNAFKISKNRRLSTDSVMFRKQHASYYSRLKIGHHLCSFKF